VKAETGDKRIFLLLRERGDTYLGSYPLGQSSQKYLGWVVLPSRIVVQLLWNYAASVPNLNEPCQYVFVPTQRPLSSSGTDTYLPRAGAI
jgi:hypothetical protein